MSDQTIYTWRRQELIDTGQVPGLTTVESADPACQRTLEEGGDITRVVHECPEGLGCVDATPERHLGTPTLSVRNVTVDGAGRRLRRQRPAFANTPLAVVGNQPHPAAVHGNRRPQDIGTDLTDRQTVNVEASQEGFVCALHLRDSCRRCGLDLLGDLALDRLNLRSDLAEVPFHPIDLGLETGHEGPGALGTIYVYLNPPTFVKQIVQSTASRPLETPLGGDLSIEG